MSEPPPPPRDHDEPPATGYPPVPGAQPPPPSASPSYQSPYEPPAPGAQPPPPASPAYRSPYEPPAPGYASAPPQNQYAPPAGQYPPPLPPHQPPPGHWGPPPPPKKGANRSLWITVAAIVGVLALGIGACTVWFVGTVKAPVDESNRFLAEIDAGNYAAAVARTDPGCNQGMTAGDLEALFGGADITYDLTSSNVTNSSATVSGSFAASNLSLRSIELYLRNNDGWRVCGFNAN